jgi:hypothetical protein
VSDPQETREAAPRDAETRDAEATLGEEHVLAARVGHGANCSSIGSVIDTLFATAVVGAAVFAAVVAALQTEDVRFAGRDEPRADERAKDAP